MRRTKAIGPLHKTLAPHVVMHHCCCSKCTWVVVCLPVFHCVVAGSAVQQGCRWWAGPSVIKALAGCMQEGLLTKVGGLLCRLLLCCHTCHDVGSAEKWRCGCHVRCPEKPLTTTSANTSTCHAQIQWLIRRTTPNLGAAFQPCADNSVPTLQAPCVKANAT